MAGTNENFYIHVITWIVVFWIVMSYSITSGWQESHGTLRMEAIASSEKMMSPTRIYGVITHNTVIQLFTAVKAFHRLVI
jgi:hypothetical protein